jgi:hypothetical protein
MKTRSLLMLAAALVAAAALAVPALARTPMSAPTGTETAARADDPASVRGFITQKKDRTILVEERPCRKDGEVVKYTRCDPSKWRGEKGYFVVGKRTVVRDASGDHSLPAGYRDLKVGQVVRATYRGPFRPSYPSEGRAKSVTILVQVARPQAG